MHLEFSQAIKVLLLVDNHCSHITIEGINYCRENGIIMIGSCIMSSDRFELIPSLLHYSNNEDHVARGRSGHDRLFKVRQLIDMIVVYFQHERKSL